MLDDSPSSRLGKAIRQAQITRESLEIQQTGQSDDLPLLGQPGDRTAAVLILRARLQTADQQDAAAVASLQGAAAQTGSTRLGQVIGTRALAIADWLIWVGPRRTAVPTDTGLAAQYQDRHRDTAKQRGSLAILWCRI